MAFDGQESTEVTMGISRAFLRYYVGIVLRYTKEFMAR